MKKIMFFFILVFMIGIVSASITERVIYKDKDLNFEVKSLWGFFEWAGINQTIVVGELKSHSSVEEVKQVGVGNQVVMYYDFTSYKGELQEILGEPTFIDVESNKEIKREWKYVYLTNESYTQDIQQCSENNLKNGSIESNCYKIGTEELQREVWKDYDSKNIPNEKIRIGIEVKNQRGDYVDGVWDIGGNKISKHAVWNSSIETNTTLWYKLEESSGAVISQVGTNGSNNGATTQQVGKVNFGYYFSTSSTRINTTRVVIPATGDFTINLWMNKTGTTTADLVGQSTGAGGRIFLYVDASGNLGTFIASSGSGDVDFIAKGVNISDGNFHMVTLRRSGTNFTLWTDGTLRNTTSVTISIVQGTNTFVGSRLTGGSGHVGNVDEVGIWNRSLATSEITALYNGNLACTWQECVSGLTVYQISPANNYYTNSNPQTLIGNATNVVALVNVSLIWNGGIDQTNTSGFNATNYTFLKNITSEGNYSWAIQACDATSCESTGNRTIVFDNSTPLISLTSPINRSGVGHFGNTTNFLNWTLVENNPDYCLYEYNGTNNSVSCFANTTSFNVSPYASLITFYVNDSLSQSNKSSLEFNYSVWVINETYSSGTTSGALESFTPYFYFPITFSGVSILLNYNGTNYTMSTSDSGSLRRYTRDLSISYVANSTNISFYYTFILANSSGTYYFNSDSRNQSISSFSIDNCSTYTTNLVNLTMYDEDTLLASNGTININIDFFSYGTTDLITSYNNSISYNSANKYSICLQNITQNYTMTYSIQFLGDPSTTLTRFKNLQRQTINPSNIPLLVNLYNLNSSRGYPFKVTVTGNLFAENGNSDLLVDAKRQYLSLNEFISVESSVTDQSGETIVHLIPNSQVYEFIVSYNGDTLGIFSNYKVQCSNQALSQCFISLNIPQSTGELSNFVNYGSISQSFEYDNSTKTLYQTFSSTDTQSKTINSYVIKADAYANETICNNTASGVSGVITCALPTSYQNDSFYVDTYVDGEYVGTKFFSQGASPEWKGADIFIIVLMFTSLTLLFASNPVLTVIGSMIGVILSLILLSVSSTSYSSMTFVIIYYIVGGIIAIIAMNKKQ